MGNYDLTKQEDIVALMKSSKSESEWNDNCDEVKIANGGDYPSFWFSLIVLSGVMSETMAGW
jgi:hypothetical protein